MLSQTGRMPRMPLLTSFPPQRLQTTWICPHAGPSHAVHRLPELGDVPLENLALPTHSGGDMEPPCLHPALLRGLFKKKGPFAPLFKGPTSPDFHERVNRLVRETDVPACKKLPKHVRYPKSCGSLCRSAASLRSLKLQERIEGHGSNS